MATIYPKRKDGKIVSFKFKTFLGRDEDGKQQFKCKTWIPDKQMTESKLLALAEKEAIIWERQVQEDIEEQENAFKPWATHKCNIAYFFYVFAKGNAYHIPSVKGISADFNHL